MARYGSETQSFGTLPWYVRHTHCSRFSGKTVIRGLRRLPLRPSPPPALLFGRKSGFRPPAVALALHAAIVHLPCVWHQIAAGGGKEGIFPNGPERSPLSLSAHCPMPAQSAAAPIITTYCDRFAFMKCHTYAPFHPPSPLPPKPKPLFILRKSLQQPNLPGGFRWVRSFRSELFHETGAHGSWLVGCSYTIPGWCVPCQPLCLLLPSAAWQSRTSVRMEWYE